MPTGYTEAVQSGEITEFRDFALRCARGMGALIMMRDEPMSAPIPDEFKPSDHYRKELDKARFRLADVQCWSDAKADLEASKAYMKDAAYYVESLGKTSGQTANYSAMLAKVEAWTPPTLDHEDLKKFMIDQLTESIRFDTYTPRPPARLTGAEFKAKEIEQAEHNIAYYEQHHADELRRTAERNAWLKALRESLA